MVLAVFRRLREKVAMKVFRLVASLALAGCAAAPVQPPQVVSTPPTENKGVSVKMLSAIELANEVNLAGYQLRARAVTIEPGGNTTAHTHQGRPTQEYVAQGTVIEIRNGKPVQHTAGTMVQGVNGVHHWWENRGTVPVILIPVDIAKP
jgi:quercetin dioxygenase-like cupin family protein